MHRVAPGALGVCLLEPHGYRRHSSPQVFRPAPPAPLLLPYLSSLTSPFRRSPGGEVGVPGASALFGGRLLTLMTLAPFEGVAV